jgi:segregation and condensation protein A
MSPTAPETIIRPTEPSGSFRVTTGNFDGPFDLLLTLIAKKSLELTELSLHEVTDDFLDYIRAQGGKWDLNEITQFLLVAATLLDLKAARLLPSGEVEDEEDVARLEARDLLFAKLLQYRAYKEVAAWFTKRLAAVGPRYARSVRLESGLAEIRPDVVFNFDVTGFAEMANRALMPYSPPVMSTEHLHAPLVSVADEAHILVEVLRRIGMQTFRDLIADTEIVAVVIARFLALLDLYRLGVVTVEQERPLADINIDWIGGAEEVSVSSEFDETSESQDEHSKADQPTRPVLVVNNAEKAS